MFRSPSLAGLPSFSVMLSDLSANHDQIARHLGLSLKTLNRYIKAEQAPRAVMLAVFWETRWGRSVADTEAANYGAIYFRQAKGLERLNAKLLKQIEVLEQELTNGSYGAANTPFFRAG